MINIIKQPKGFYIFTSALYLFVINLTVFFIIACDQNLDDNLKNVTVRVYTDSLPTTEKVFITGNVKELAHWDPNDIPMHRMEEGIWERDFQFPQGTHLEFKFTRGSWATEALRPDGIEYPNFNYKVENDTILEFQILSWRDSFRGVVPLSPERLANKLGRIEFSEGWLYRPGDNTDWANLYYDDSQWIYANPHLLPQDLQRMAWPGIGWFRLHLQVDSSLWQKPFALSLSQVGASEIYLNGRLLYEFGKINSPKGAEEPFSPTEVRFLSFDDQEKQVLAVRYANSATEYFSSRGFQSGFSCSIGDLNDTILSAAHSARRNSIFQVIFTAVPITLALIHLLLFLFYLPARDNLFYSLFMITFALLSYANFGIYFTNNFWDIVIYILLINISMNLSLIFGLLITYWRHYKYIPKQFYFFLAVAIIFIILNLFWPTLNFIIPFYIFLTVTALEIIRMVILMVFSSNEKDWIGVVGFFFLFIAITYQLLLDNEMLEPLADFTVVYVYGILVFGITMSINLARDFARSNRQLIKQEREMREQEIERRVMEADYSRKTAELEEARRLQVGMLPRKVPEVPHLDIAVYMKTATEVGGDYYDFNQTSDGTLTIAIGDATGHGIKAGVMVTLVKSLFNTMAHTFYIPDFFIHCTKMIRKMNFYNLYMSLMLVRITNHKLKVSAAGMPPLLIYRKTNNQVEEMVVKGLPLGGPAAATYEQRQTDLKKGDVILMMTDGYMELFNPAKETFDFERVKEIFLRYGHKNPTDIIQDLVEAGERWRGDQSQGDDVTFVIIKVKE